MPQLAQHIFKLLHAQGVQHAFGIPGDFALALYDVLDQSPIKTVVMTHEPCAGFAADAYARNHLHPPSKERSPQGSKIETRAPIGYAMFHEAT